MTPLPTLTDRKDIDTLIFHQIQTACLQSRGDGGYGTASVMAFLIQLYAYIFAKFGEDSPGVHCTANKEAEGTEALKAHLMTTGPYHVVVYTTNFRARPNALRLRKRPVGYCGASIGSWIILWPGAKRDSFSEWVASCTRFKEPYKIVQTVGRMERQRYSPTVRH